MMFFGRKSGRQSARPALTGTRYRSLGDWPRGYEAQVRAAYCENAVAQRAVRLVAESAGTAPLAGDDRARALIANARQPLIEQAISHVLLHGNAFIQIIGDASGKPVDLFALRPERVTVEPDPQGWPAAYRYQVGERVNRFAVADGLGHPAIAHVRAVHPLDDHYGLGSLGAAAGPVAIHNAATRWNKALLDNAARPSGALVFDPGEAGATLSPDQFDRLKEEMTAGFAGAANAGRPMLLEGGLRWQAMSLTPADMDFVGLKAAAAREIALTFGVPPMLLGLPGDNSYANYREANRALWRLAILPVAEKLLAELARALTAWWPEASLAIDLDRVPALSEDRERLWAQVGAADFLSPEEKRALLGIDR
jgi:HK97 family phage portal protein